MSRCRPTRKSSRNRSSGGFSGVRFETLESRTLLSVFNLKASAGDAGLRAAILAADTNGDLSNTINLAAGKYLLTNAGAGNILIQSGAKRRSRLRGPAPRPRSSSPALR